MFLKTVELTGFKSFPSKTAIHFEKGITAIVGPNGSGKSNISDAIRWVFGEMSSKVLRGAKMEDVIFGGTKEIKPSSFARVSLVIDNSDKLVDCDYSEIKITRQLARSGESGYFINDRSVRLKDIYELFLNTGVGREGYSIIGQGRISELISRRSEDRRSIFEEASGISKYRYRKSEAEKKLADVRDNLTRIKDIVYGLEERIGPLSAESEKARKYLDLSERKKSLEIYVWVNSIEKMKNEFEKIIGDYEISKFNYESADAQFIKLNEKTENLYNKIQELNLLYENKKNENFRVQTGIVEKKGEIENIKNSISKIGDEIEFNSYEIEKNVGEIANLDKEIAIKNEAIDKIKSEYKKLEIEIEDTVSYAEHIDLKLAEQNNKSEDLNDIIVGLNAEIKELQRLEKVRSREYDAIYLEHEKTENYIQSLTRIYDNLEGYPESVKSVVKSGLPGINGTVAQLVEVEPQYAAAIEVALGQNLQNIIVDDESSAKEAIKYLKTNNLGRATFYPVSIIKGRFIERDKLDYLRRNDNASGFVDIGSSLVKYDQKYDSIIKYLLGRTIICDNINSAAKIAEKLQYMFKIVTLDGQVINAGGSFTGGSAIKKSAMLSTKNEIENLKKKNIDLAEKLASYDLKEFERKIAECEKKLEEEYAIALAQHKAEIKKITEDKDITIMKLNKQRLFLSSVSNNINIENERLENLNRAKINLKNQNEKISAQNQEKKLELSRAENDIKTIKEEISALEKTVKETELALLDCENNRNNLEKENAETKNNIKEKGNERDTLFKETTRLESMKNEKEKEHDSIISRLWEEYNLTFTEAKELVVNSAEITVIVENADKANAIPKELAKIKSAIKELGNVNVNAIEEYKEVSEKYNFLTAQSGDLNDSLESLQKIIDNLEIEMKNVFSQSMTQINKNFKEVFSELFGGGTAEIIYTDPDNVLESELEIEVQPPGKNVKHISLLSGGEQAFVAIALYFALLKINPAPFCVLDEIEAALDEVNVDRFAVYLKRYSEQTQFIVISHRRGTMEAANRLYGITMQDKGVSKYLALDINEAERRLKHSARV